MAAKIAIAPGSAVAAYHVDFRVRLSDRGDEITQQIKQPRIDVMDIASAMVAQETFELVNSLGHILITNSINDIDVFVSVGVIEPQPMDFTWIVARRSTTGSVDCGRRHDGNQDEQDENEITQETVF